MPEFAHPLPDFNAYVTIGQVVAELLELEWIDPDDIADRESTRLLAERLNAVAPDRQLPLALSA